MKRSHVRRRGSFLRHDVMGLIKAVGCLIFVLFSCYVLLQAERGRRYLVAQPHTAKEDAGQLPVTSPALSDKESVWTNLGVNLFLLISTLLCYDLVVTNILVFSLATDRFFLRTPLRVLLCAMVGVLAAAAWFEVPALR